MEEKVQIFSVNSSERGIGAALKLEVVKEGTEPLNFRWRGSGGQ